MIRRFAVVVAFFAVPLFAADLPYTTLRIDYTTVKETRHADGKSLFQTEGTETRFIDAANNRIRIEIVETKKAGDFRASARQIRIMNENNLVVLDAEEKAARTFPHDTGGRPVWRDGPSGGGRVVQKKEEKERVLGRECDVVKENGDKRWLWNGLILKQELRSGFFTYKKTPVRMEPNVKLDPKLFSIPEDYHVR